MLSGKLHVCTVTVRGDIARNLHTVALFWVSLPEPRHHISDKKGNGRPFTKDAWPGFTLNGCVL